MRRYLSIIALLALCVPAFAQTDKLAGRWEGKTQSPQGERATTATFKKAGDGYTGIITGLSGEMPLKDITKKTGVTFDESVLAADVLKDGGANESVRGFKGKQIFSLANVILD